MPVPTQAPMNPNDGMSGGYGQKKRQFVNVNQHYISHNAVLPPYDLGEALNRVESSVNNYPPSSPYKDPYAGVALKPNQVASHDRQHHMHQL